MSGVKKRIHDINRGVNLKKNLPLYGEEFADVYLHYAALELTFSVFSLFDFMSGEITNAEWVSPDEEKRYRDVSELLRRMLEEDKKPFSEAVYDTVAQRADEIREEITLVMEVYTSYADQLVSYDYQLDRIKYGFRPEKELQQEMRKINEDEWLNRLMQFVFGTDDVSIQHERLRKVICEIPVHMTKGKLFERIHRTLSIYQEGDRLSLERYIYLLRSVATLEKPDDRIVSDDWFRDFLEQLINADYSEMDEVLYKHLSDKMRETEKRLRQVTDFYYSLQEVVNQIYALCLIRPHKETVTNVYADCMDVLQEVLAHRFSEESLESLEGIIEDYVERAGYLESVLPEVRSVERELLEDLGLAADFDDYAAVVKLLSDSLFIPVEEGVYEEVVDQAVIDEVYGELTAELSELFRTLPRGMKRIVMSRVLGELPMTFQNVDDCMEYIRLNLFGCQNLAERKAALVGLEQIMKEEEIWNLKWGGEDDLLV